MIPVALVMIAGGNNANQTAKTLNHCSYMLHWSQVLFFTYEIPKETLNSNIQIIPIPWLSWPEGNNEFQVNGFLDHLNSDTSHILYMQNDGYILNPHLWDDQWLDYDYIAPPWGIDLARYDKTHRVGCGGFALKSKRFLEALKERYIMVKREEPLDVYECQSQRSWFEAQGIKYAPIEVAIKFGVEGGVEEFPEWNEEMSFGFHNVKPNTRRQLLP